MGITHSLNRLSQIFPPKSKFTVNDIPDLSGRVMIVTGANTGIGKETAKALLAHNAKVYLACRSESKAQDAIEELRQVTGKEGIFLPLDLADLLSVKAAAQTFLSKENELHVLFNNGGVMGCPVEDTTAQGYDRQFGVNVLGHFYFTKLLLPALSAGAKTSQDRYSRVVTTSSSAHELISTIDFNTLKDSPARGKKSSLYFLYPQSKLGNVIVSNEFSKRSHDQGIVFTSLNPGNIITDIQRHMSWFASLLLNMVLYDVSYGALTQLYAGTAPDAVSLNGKYLFPFARVGTATAAAQNPELSKDLWIWLEEQVKDL